MAAITTKVALHAQVVPHEADPEDDNHKEQDEFAPPPAERE
jgi:hypothetical protein